MTWRWDVEDLDFRVTFARIHGPTDFLTVLARLVVSRVTWLLTLLLKPLDIVLRFIGKGLVAVVLGFMVLMILDILWLMIWGLLFGSSWLWLRYPLLRVVLILPGVAVAIFAHIVIMLAPDPHKNAKYTSVSGEWPLTWRLWHPTEAYFDAHGG